jgi:uncharacterized protein (TIGR02145 family)
MRKALDGPENSLRRGVVTKPLRSRVLAIALSLFGGFISVSCSTHREANDQEGPGEITSSVRMPDGSWWMMANLDVNTSHSYCYDDIELNCRRYGRLYTWESAQQGCQLLGNGWRLPTNEEWQQMAKQYGGVYDDSDDGGKAAYEALLIGGTSGFDALLGGGRASDDGQYARLEAHGFYWTASESDAARAWFYNFGRGARYLNRHSDGEKQRAFSVRCIK